MHARHHATHRQHRPGELRHLRGSCPPGSTSPLAKAPRWPPRNRPGASMRNRPSSNAESPARGSFGKRRQSVSNWPRPGRSCLLGEVRQPDQRACARRRPRSHHLRLPSSCAGTLGTGAHALRTAGPAQYLAWWQPPLAIALANSELEGSAWGESSSTNVPSSPACRRWTAPSWPRLRISTAPRSTTTRTRAGASKTVTPKSAVPITPDIERADRDHEPLPLDMGDLERRSSTPELDVHRLRRPALIARRPMGSTSMCEPSARSTSTRPLSLPNTAPSRTEGAGRRT